MKEYTIIAKQGFCGPSFEITGTLEYLKCRFKLTKDICYIAEKCEKIKEPKTIKSLLTALRKKDKYDCSFMYTDHVAYTLKED